MPSTLRSSRPTDARRACRSSEPMCSTCFRARRSMQRLLDEAIASGAVLVAGRLVSCERVAAGWTLNTTAGPVSGSWLLGADGASGVVRKRVFRPFLRRQLSIAAGSFVEDVTADEIVIHFIDRPRGYLWSFPRRDHLAVGACAQADGTTAGELHAIVDRWLDTYAPARERHRRRYVWPIPSLSAPDLDIERPAGDRWMLLGDAAGLVDPITREGIFFALRSGSLAAAALAGSDPSTTYGHSIHEEIHSEIKRADRIARVVLSASLPAPLDWRAGPEPGDPAGHGRPDWRASAVRRPAAQVDGDGRTGIDAEATVSESLVPSDRVRSPRKDRNLGRLGLGTWDSGLVPSSCQISIARSNGDVGSLHADSNGAPLPFPCHDRRRRHVTKEVLLPQLRGDGLHGGVQLRCVLRLE